MKPRDRSLNVTDQLIVEDVQATDCGDALITLTGGYRIVLFPAGTDGEDWRLFKPGSGSQHLVVRGGVVEESEHTIEPSVIDH